MATKQNKVKKIVHKLQTKSYVWSERRLAELNMGKGWSEFKGEKD